MKAVPTAFVALAAVSALTFTAMPSATAAAGSKTCGKDKAKGLEAVALTKDNRLLCLKVADPDDARSLGKVKGLDAGTKLIGIDFSAENNKLYGVGSNGAIYTIALKSAKASKVSTITGATLEGTSFGVDFNPTSNALRIISNTGQNLRIAMVATGAAMEDPDLTNPAVAPNPAAVALGVTGAAYTNTDKVTKANTGTSLFDIDTTNDRVALQAPANPGTLNPTGKLGRNVDPDNGFDIYSVLKKGQARSNLAYAALSNGSRSTLYKVDLLDGSLSSQGTFDKNRGEIIGLALLLDQD